MSPEAETDLWWKSKLAQWKRQKRLRPDGTLKVDVSMSLVPKDMSPGEVGAMLFGKPPKDSRLARQEINRMRGRRVKTWRRRFDRSGPDE